MLWYRLNERAKPSAHLDTPFKPHIVGVDFHIQLGFEADLGQELIIPADLRLCHGPRLPEHSWDMLFHSTAEDEISIEFPFSKDANRSMTTFLARFSNTAEKYLMATDPSADEAMRGRCWSMHQDG